MAKRIALSVVMAVAASFAMVSEARAQGPLDPTGVPTDDGTAVGTPSQSGKQPETHAASGGETPAQLPTEEAQLPEKPNEIPAALAPELGSDFSPDEEPAPAGELERRFYGLYYSEEKDDYAFRTVLPPLWLERRDGDDYQTLIGLSYFHRRSPEVDADVLFPIFWNFRHDQTYTTVVGPVVHEESPVGHKNWLVPLYFEGSGEDGEEYLHIPPLLTYHHRTARDGLTIVGPLYCRWKGGSRCDGRTADDIDMGLAPFYFYGRSDRSEYEVIPPLLHYYHYTDVGDSEVEVWGPVWLERSREGGVVDVLPLFWHNWTDTSHHTTLFPLFHYGDDEEAQTIVTPLFYDRQGTDGSHTLVTPLWAMHRGRTELDMITPLLWLYRDPDIQQNRVLAFPFVYRNVSNRDDDIVIFPFYGHFERHAIRESWWITPFFRHETSLTGWNTDIFPIFYSGRENRNTHLVVAPILWDFASPSDRQTVVFPFYWRFADTKNTYQVVGNTYYYEERAQSGKSWEFHFFPLFSYGESPQGHWWNVLYGLAGYTRDGTMAKMRALYIPIKLSE
jgi:hypothetical protein